MIKIFVLAMTLSLFLPLKSFAGLGDLDLGNFEDITKGLKDAVDKLDKNLKDKNQNNQPVNNSDKPPASQPETAEEKQKRLEAEKKAEQEKKKKLEAKKKAEQEKKKKLEAKKKAEQEKQRKLQAQRAAEEAERQRIEAEERAAFEAEVQRIKAEQKAKDDALIASINEKNLKAIKVFTEELMFSKSDEVSDFKTEKFNEINNTPLYSEALDKAESYCKSFKYEDLLNSISENIEMSGFYQSKLRLIRDILVHNAEFINAKKYLDEHTTLLKNMGTDSVKRVDYSDIISEIKQKAKERGLKTDELPLPLADLIDSEPGKKDTEYFWLSGNYVFDQPDDKKLSMLNNSRVDLLFYKFGEDSNWEICDYKCLVGPKLFLDVDLDNEHRTLFLHDLNLSESGGWRTANSLKILRQNSYGSEDVQQFTPTWLHNNNYNLFDFLAPESSKAFASHYVNHQDWLVHVALAQALLHKNPDYQTCWGEYIK